MKTSSGISQPLKQVMAQGGLKQADLAAVPDSSPSSNAVSALRLPFFDEATLRLKQLLKVTEDKQVAEVLGMSGNAWTKRKTRGAFPEKELYALAAKRPELGVDVAYVLTGERMPLPICPRSDRTARQTASAALPKPRFKLHLDGRLSLMRKAVGV